MPFGARRTVEGTPRVLQATAGSPGFRREGSVPSSGPIAPAHTPFSELRHPGCPYPRLHPHSPSAGRRMCSRAGAQDAQGAEKQARSHGGTDRRTADRTGGLRGGRRGTAGRPDGRTVGRVSGSANCGPQGGAASSGGVWVGSAQRPVRPPRPAAGLSEGSPESRLGAAQGAPTPRTERCMKFIF